MDRPRSGEGSQKSTAGRRLTVELAYATVVTVLTRLSVKGMVDRKKVRRGYVYSARFDERGLIAYLRR